MESQKNYHDKPDSSLAAQQQNKTKPLTFLNAVKFLHKSKENIFFRTKNGLLVLLLF